MPSGTVSAVPSDLFRYADRAQQIDRELIATASSLGGSLARYEATCAEYRISVGHLADTLRAAGQAADAVDAWVRQVGVRFQNADSLLRPPTPPQKADRRPNWFDKVKTAVRDTLTSLEGWLRRLLGLPTSDGTAGSEQPSSDMPSGQPISYVPTLPRPENPNPEYYGFGDIYASGPYAGKPHQGLDIGGRLGDPIYPIGPGRVTDVAFKEGYGWTVIVEHELEGGNKITSLYAHLDGKPPVSVGDIVSPNTALGAMGMSGTGAAGVVHLHLEIGKEGKTIDPETVFGNASYTMVAPTDGDHIEMEHFLRGMSESDQALSTADLAKLANFYNVSLAGGETESGGHAVKVRGIADLLSGLTGKEAYAFLSEAGIVFDKNRWSNPGGVFTRPEDSLNQQLLELQGDPEAIDKQAARAFLLSVQPGSVVSFYPGPGDDLVSDLISIGTQEGEQVAPSHTAIGAGYGMLAEAVRSGTAKTRALDAYREQELHRGGLRVQVMRGPQALTQPQSGHLARYLDEKVRNNKGYDFVELLGGPDDPHKYICSGLAYDALRESGVDIHPAMGVAETVTQVTVLSILMGPIGVPLGIWGSVSRVSPWEMERATVNGMPLDTTYKYLPEGYRSPKQRWSDRPLEEAVGVPSRLVDLAVSVALDPHGVQVIPEVGLAADMPGSDAWSRAVDSYQERFAGKAGSGR